MEYYDYYKVLGVHSNASIFEIKKAFKRKAKLIHPDVNPSPKAKDAFQVLQRAYSTLNNPRTRKQYDLKLQLINASRIIKRNRSTTNYSRENKRPPYAAPYHSSYEHFEQPAKLFVILLYVFGIFVGTIFMVFSLSIFFLDDPSYVLAFLSLPGFILIRDGISGLRRQRLGDGNRN